VIRKGEERSKRVNYAARRVLRRTGYARTVQSSRGGRVLLLFQKGEK
jgi:hypothetical protein